MVNESCCSQDWWMIGRFEMKEWRSMFVGGSFFRWQPSMWNPWEKRWSWTIENEFGKASGMSQKCLLPLDERNGPSWWLAYTPAAKQQHEMHTHAGRSIWLGGKRRAIHHSPLAEDIHVIRWWYVCIRQTEMAAGLPHCNKEMIAIYA